MDDPTSRDPDLPPVYSASALPAKRDPFEEAVRRAKLGAPAGTFLWSRRADRIALAVVLEPDHPRNLSLLVSFTAQLAFVDALSGIVPPLVAVTFSWPDRIDVNGALAGGLRIAVADTDAPNAVPDWLVVAIYVAVTNNDDDVSPGLKPDRTSLFNEGCGFVDVVDFMERFSRHFMYWINRWQEDGFEPVRLAWLARESGFGEETVVFPDNKRVTGHMVMLDLCGGAVIEGNDGKQTFALDAALRTGSWSLTDLAFS